MILLPLLALLSCISSLDGAVIGSRVQDQTGIIQTFLSYRADIGLSLPRRGIEGILVLSSPANRSRVGPRSEYACAPVKPAKKRNISGYPWVLLVKRGVCDFELKLVNAERAGYELVIVYNNDDDRLIPMHGTGDVHVSAVFVGLSAGEALKGNYLFDFNPTATVTLTPYYSLSWHMYIIPFLVVVAICFILMLIFLLIKKLRRYQRRRRARLSPSKLDKLQVIIFSLEDGYDMCAICLDDFEEGEKLRILPCDHAFHTHCIDPWLTKRRKVCPCCKQVVLPDKLQSVTRVSPPALSLSSEESSASHIFARSGSRTFCSDPVEEPDEDTPLLRTI